MKMVVRDIAVVIVTYKTAILTINCLRSISAERETSALNIRVVVVDNASGDTEEIAKAIESNDWSSWISVVTAPRNGGFAYGNNLGIGHAYMMKPPAYVHLLNPDTEIRPRAILSLVEFLESNKEVGIVGSGIENQDGSDWPIGFRFPSLLSELNGGLNFGLVTRLLRRWEVAKQMSKMAQPIDWISGASMMVRPEVLSAIGGLDENYFLYFEETDFCYRAKRAGFSTWYFPESRVMHIEGQSTKVGGRVNRPRRLPAYWFASRRRYFAATFGIRHAMAIDVVAILAHSLGFLKRIALGRTKSAIPHFIRDLTFYSVLWPRNRNVPPIISKTFSQPH